MKEITAFQCDYCTKHYLHKKSALRHEKGCYKNPQNRNCYTCENHTVQKESIYLDEMPMRSTECHWCEAKQCELILFEMPFDCEHHETKGGK